MKRFIVPVIFVVASLAGFIYIFPSNAPFPGPPPDAVQSMEEADTETPFRRAYFTNYTREQVIAHYAAQMQRFPYLRLNYPPEDAQTIIRDQTRSWYLEELVQPLRQSVFINGFIAQKPQDDIWYKGVHYQQKITIRLVQAERIARIVILLGSIYATFLLYLAVKKMSKSLISYIHEKN